jgi:hypothetical protein
MLVRLAPDSSHLIGTASPQLSGDGHSRYVFDSWSDPGVQSHSIIAPLTGATRTATFLTNYLLDITVTPPVAGTVTADPFLPRHLAVRASLVNTAQLDSLPGH